jgi:hypothetical protein
MNRKLHNTASALMASGTLLVLALMVQASDSSFDAPPASTAAAVASAALTAPEALATEEPAASVRSARASRVRHSVAMPFFSFAPRG